MNSLSASKDQLADAARQLSVNWNIAKEFWNDSARQDFEANFWVEFDTSTAASIEKLQELAIVFAQAEREIP